MKKNKLHIKANPLIKKFKTMKKIVVILAIINLLTIPVFAWDKSDDEFLNCAIKTGASLNSGKACTLLSCYILSAFKSKGKTINPEDKAFLILLESCASKQMK